MAQGFEPLPERTADFFDHIEARKPAGQVDADTDHGECGQDLQDKVGIAWADRFHDGLAKGAGNSPGQGIAGEATKIEDGCIAEQTQGGVTHLFGQTHGEGADDTAAHPQTVESAEQANHEGVKNTQVQLMASRKDFAQCTGKSIG